MTDYLARYGRQAVNNGYRILPIRPRGEGETEKSGKAPGTLVPYQLLGGWQNLNWTVGDVDRSVSQGNGSCGIGVLTRDTPAADIDCHEEAIVDKIRAFIIDRLGPTIERIGQAPKTLLLFSTPEPFGKVTSKGYTDSRERPAKLEILASGQQFVALAHHPVTGSPYVWLDGKSIADTETWELPVMTRADALAICAEFDRLATGAGWSVTSDAARGNYVSDDPFVSDRPKVTDLSGEQIRKIVEETANDDDYDTWIQVGMALFHQFEGEDAGLDLWLEWSDKSFKCEPDIVRHKWESGTFNVEGSGLAPTTFRFIIKLHESQRQQVLATQFDTAMQNMLGAKTKEDLAKASKLVRSLDITDFDRKELAGHLRSRFKEITGTTLLAAEAARMTRYSPSMVPTAPDWLEGYVYVAADKGFFSLRTGKTSSIEVFDAVHSRLLLTTQDRLEGRAKPENRPSDIALNLHAVPVVEDRRYMPDEPGALVTINDVPYVNSYAERGLPMVPSILTSTGTAAIDRLQGHIRHLIENERDAAIFTSWLAYIVQTKRRVNWGVFLQGAQGDGKTFFTEMMGAVLGGDNVKIITGSSLEEKYTGFAEQALVVFVEEVRLGGEHRFKVIDKVKPLITNPTISVRRMHRDEYMVANKASYFLISNFRDALPVGDEDNRYFPVFSRWQSQEKLVEFKAANPRYYRDLYGSLTEAGSIRKWLMGYDLSSHFDASDRAPISSNKHEMTEASQDPAADALRALIETGNDLDFCPTLVDSGLISQRMYEREPGMPAMTGKRQHQYMQKIGYTSLGGQVKVDGAPKRFWSREPERFRRTDATGMTVTDTAAVRAWLSTDL